MTEKLKPQTQLWRVPAFDDLELLHAQHQTQTFPKHAHERYALGVIEQGALGFYYRGENVVAPASTISLCIPGEVHTGQPAIAEGWTYRMFYFETRFLEKVTSELAGKPRDLPFFQFGVIADAKLARRLRALHVQLATAATPALEQETSLLNTLAVLIRRYADDAPPTFRVGRETRAVMQVKNYLESHYADDVSLASLSHLTGLSRYHLVRVFRDAVGIPPMLTCDKCASDMPKTS